jgi:hypothetical protein
MRNCKPALVDSFMQPCSRQTLLISVRGWEVHTCVSVCCNGEKGGKSNTHCASVLSPNIGSRHRMYHATLYNIHFSNTHTDHTSPPSQVIYTASLILLTHCAMRYVREFRSCSPSVRPSLGHAELVTECEVPLVCGAAVGCIFYIAEILHR